MTVVALPRIEIGPAAAAAWVATNLDGLFSGDPVASPRLRGGQTAADTALATFDVRGYASNRNQILPEDHRGASQLSAYIRHGLLSLPAVWDAIDGGPRRDVRKFRDELLWQEYARHVYARLGLRTGESLRAEPPLRTTGDPWSTDMACVNAMLEDLETDGWVVNQGRMWLASHWAVRHGADWRRGEDRFFRHLLDGSRAANRLGWQWTVGSANQKPYGFSRHQVVKRAPELCARCPLADACPIEDWPDRVAMQPVETPLGLRHDPDPGATAGPSEPIIQGEPDAVWLTAESLGDDDPALAAHPDLPAVFVFDDRLLAGLRLSGKRGVFLAETLADLATRRRVEIHRGDPVSVLAGRSLATTAAPVPGWRRRSARLTISALYPWPWLIRPSGGPITSFSAWRASADA